MGKSTISMAIFNSYVKLPEGNGWNMVFFSRETGWKMLKKWGIDDGLMMV